MDELPVIPPESLSDVEVYRCAALSSAHLGPDDRRALTRYVESGAEQMVTERDTGFFVKLYEEWACNAEAAFMRALSKRTRALIQALHRAGFRLIEFDGDAILLPGLWAED